MATYYVATNGNNSNNGSISSPWRDLHVAAGRLANNDTLYVRGGTYALPSAGEITIRKSGVTMAAYESEVPIIDGRAVFNTKPWPNTISSNPVGTAEFTPIITLNATGITLKGLRIRNSAGEGIRVNAKNCTIDDVHCDTSWGAGISFMEGSSGIAKDCSVTKSGRKGTQAALRGRYVGDPVTFLRCKVSHGGGEGLSSIQSDHITMRDCEVWDNNKTQIYLEGTRHSTVDGCLIYCTNEIETGGFSASEGIHIASELYPQGAWVCEDIEITNNLIVGCGPNLKMAGGIHRGTPVTDWGMRNLRVFHNTFVNARADACLIIGNQSPADNNKNNTQSWFANNIIVQTGSLAIVKTFSGTDFSKFVFRYNIWSKQPIAPFYNSGTDVVGSAGLVSPPNLLTKRSDMNINDYKITSGSPAVNAATKQYEAASGTTVTDDYFDSARGASPDRGFHEYGGTGADKVLVAGYSVSPGATINAGGAITFSDNSTTGGGVSITSREWAFAGGSPASSTAASPVVTYAEPGIYEVTYTVHDSVNNRHHTTSGTVTIKAEDSGTVSPLETNLVDFLGGATSFAHGMDSAPKAILFFASPATAEDTLLDGARMSIGMYAAGSSAAIATNNPYGTSEKLGSRRLASGIVLEDLEDGVTLSVTAISATTVSLSWTGVPSTYKCAALCIGGSGVSNATVDVHNFVSSPSANKPGTYTLLFVIGAGNVADGTGKWGAALSFGMAISGGNQAVVAFSEPRNSALKAIAMYDWVSYYPALNWGVSSSFLNGYTLTASSKSDTAVAVMALNVTADMALEFFGTPVTTAAADYTWPWAVEFDPGTMLAVMSNLPSLTLASGANAGFFGVYATDGTDERTIAVTNEDDQLPVNSGSITDDSWIQRNDDGTNLMAGAVTLGNEKFTMTMSTEDATARKFLALLLEGTVVGVAPTADFAITWADKLSTDVNPTMGVELTFNNLTTAGAAALDTYAWDFGDDTTSTDASPTKTYNLPGTYTVTLVVTDEDSETGTVTKNIIVELAEPDYVVTIDPMQLEVPDTVEIDASATTWGDLTIDWDLSRIGIFVNLPEDETSNRYHVTNVWWKFTTDGVAEFLIDEADIYSVAFWIVSTTGEFYLTNWMYNNASAYWGDLIEALAPEGLYLEQWPALTGFVGPMARYFQILGNRTGLHQSVFQWDFGDGDTLEDDIDAVWHTYAAVDEVTSYDVTVDILYPNGDVSQLVVTNAVTVYPARIPPIPLQTLAAQWATYMEHVGDLTGAAWVRQASPNSNVYLVELSHAWAINMTPRVYEDGVALTERASIALCQANPGSYYATNTDGEIAIYVHPLQSDNPNANGNAYRWID